ncbi:MAG: hypothetical protein DBX47_04710 [Clostridiales bacterium]|nr:MAG: hypothetical protein DBX47_04710 [Clostridiales bacterium]
MIVNAHRGVFNMYIAGTQVEQTAALKGSTLLERVFAVTSGITLSQVTEITGLCAPTLQNWIKRGWTSSPVNKKYSIDQVARMIIINALRDVMPLENIAYLMQYINGDANSRLDDIIPESQLYFYFSVINERCGNNHFDEKQTIKLINEVCSDYKENTPGGEKRLKNALKIMIYTYRASLYKKEVEQMIAELRENSLN